MIAFTIIVGDTEWGWEPDGYIWSRNPGGNWPNKPNATTDAPEELKSAILAYQEQEAKAVFKQLRESIDRDHKLALKAIEREHKLAQKSLDRDHKLAVNADFVWSLWHEGFDRAQITVRWIDQYGKMGLKPATLYRQVDQSLMDAGIRERPKMSRAPHTRDPLGEAALPLLLRGL